MNNYYANNGIAGHEFVACISPKGIPPYWEAARAALHMARHALAARETK